MDEIIYSQEETPEQYVLDETSLMNNANPRTPITICVDCSYSMLKPSRLDKRSRLEKVMEGIQSFCDDMRKDPIARDMVEICIISYGDNQAKVECRFCSPDAVKVPQLKAKGDTPLVKAIQTALRNLEERRKRYLQIGLLLNRPWLIIIGDGDESQSQKELATVAAQLKKESDNKQLSVICVLVGDEDKLEYNSLKQIAPDHKINYLDDLKFRQFFTWLSRNVSQQSQSLSTEEYRNQPTDEWSSEL